MSKLVTIGYNEGISYKQDEEICIVETTGTKSKLDFYRSMVNNNKGNPLDDDTKWEKIIIGLNTGIMCPFGGETPPDGWLLCDGGAISRTTYRPLFDVIGTAYGVGDGSTTFNLPNAIGRYIGYNGRGYIEAGLPQHTHNGTTDNMSANATGGVSGLGTGWGGYNAGGVTPVGTGNMTASKTSNAPYNQEDGNHYQMGTGSIAINVQHNHSFTTGNAVGSIWGASDTVQPATLRANIIIKY